MPVGPTKYTGMDFLGPLVVTARCTSWTLAKRRGRESREQAQCKVWSIFLHEFLCILASERNIKISGVVSLGDVVCKEECVPGSCSLPSCAMFYDLYKPSWICWTLTTFPTNHDFEAWMAVSVMRNSRWLEKTFYSEVLWTILVLYWSGGHVVVWSEENCWSIRTAMSPDAV